MHELGVTIGGEVFGHLLYHFVLTYSDWGADYEGFLRKLFEQLNAGRARKLGEERTHLRPLPTVRLDCFKKVGPIPSQAAPRSSRRTKSTRWTVALKLKERRLNV
jgi:hypothetical protein